MSRVGTPSFGGLRTRAVVWARRQRVDPACPAQPENWPLSNFSGIIYPFYFCRLVRAGRSGEFNVMRASAHVGRVGGLAVALGIGAAVVSGGAGFAWATPADTSDSPASADSAAQSDAPTSAPGSRGGRPAGRVAPAASLGRGGGAQQRQQQANSSPRPNSKPTVAVSDSALRRVSPERSSRIDLAARVAAATRAEPATGASVAAEVMTAPVSVAPAAAAPVMVAAPATASVGSVPSPLLGSGTGIPVESPVSWMVLAAARREPEAPNTVVAPSVTVSASQSATPAAAAAATAAVTNSAPVIANVALSAPNASTGAVTGTVTATDPESDALTYRATTSTKGAVSITTAGVFTYTPTATARHAAAKSGAATSVTTDTVTVTVTDANLSLIHI